MSFRSTRSHALNHWTTTSVLALAFCATILPLCRIQCSPMTSIYQRSHHGRLEQTDLSPKDQFENAYKEAVGELRSNLRKHADNFDEFFREILKVSHANFHRMFSDTYGILYDRHSSIFNDMFRDLEIYYTTGSIDLTLAMKRFFSLLYKKMFEELNAQYAFDARYLNCTVEHMEEMMPFGELPQKLILQIKRSFIAIRTFVQALNYGHDILRTIMELPVTNTCENRLRAISYCKSCSFHISSVTSLCQNTCGQILEKACFPCHDSLNREWNQYFNELAKLASRLKTSFNIELVVKPINIKISEAIMIFQENGVAISQRLFSKCGRPVIRKHDKRSTHLYEDNSGKPKSLYDASSKHRQQLNIDNLINDLLKHFKHFRNFWSKLPYQLCSHYSQAPKCNSHHTQRFGEVPNYKDKNNVEIINQQIATLKLISTNLNNAYNGLDVDLESNFKLMDNGNLPVDDEMLSSGDSSGSGDFTDDEDIVIGRKPIVESNSSNSDIAYNTVTPSTVPTTQAQEEESDILIIEESKTPPSSSRSLTMPPIIYNLIIALSAFIFHKLFVKY